MKSEAGAKIRVLQTRLARLSILMKTSRLEDVNSMIRLNNVDVVLCRRNVDQCWIPWWVAGLVWFYVAETWMSCLVLFELLIECYPVDLIDEDDLDEVSGALGERRRNVDVVLRVGIRSMRFEELLTFLDRRTKICNHYWIQSLLSGWIL